jgi:hypothetical protein
MGLERDPSQLGTPLEVAQPKATVFVFTGAPDGTVGSLCASMKTPNSNTGPGRIRSNTRELEAIDDISEAELAFGIPPRTVQLAQTVYGASVEGVSAQVQPIGAAAELLRLETSRRVIGTALTKVVLPPTPKTAVVTQRARVVLTAAH